MYCVWYVTAKITRKIGTKTKMSSKQEQCWSTYVKDWFGTAYDILFEIIVDSVWIITLDYSIRSALEQLHGSPSKS